MIGTAIAWILRVVPWWGYVVAGALVVTLVTGWHLSAVSSAKKAGIEQDKARSDGVIAQMILEHSQNVAKENAKVEAIEAMMRKVKEGAENAIKTANQATANIRAAFAAVRDERDGLRNALVNSIATGGVEASADSVQACRDRAETAGGLLVKALRVSQDCAGDAEDLATGVRGLSAAWDAVAAIR
jgi:hypothetical protein